MGLQRPLRIAPPATSLVAGSSRTRAQSARNLCGPIGNDSGVAHYHPRRQGDLGELSAMQWLASQGADLYTPFGHSPDIDLIAALDGRLIRVEVKTSISKRRGRWQVSIATRGGNQSWTGVVKRFDPARCDYLFVHVGDGRRWFIPTPELEGHSGLHLGGPKYSEFEVEGGSPLPGVADPPLESQRSPGEYPSGQRGGAVNAMALPSQVRILPPPSPHPDRGCSSVRSVGRTRLSSSHQVTITSAPFAAASLEVGDLFRVEASGPGRLVLTRVQEFAEDQQLLLHGPSA